MTTATRLRPFHYAFLVTDLDATRRFYGQLLGCTEGRSTDHWVDFDFFGNQISAHLSDHIAPANATGQVDGIDVPMPHFGAVLSWDAFHEAAERLRAAGTRFVIEPRLRYAGQPGEQMTMFLTDPSGNALEFKAFRNDAEVFAR
ncbi:MAG TPA: VOC family protein [Gemmatimonadales bacterium]|nr:VOC family protein [Gemmatimonadales bacterium]